MKVLLNVPFDEKDDAKFLGAKWDKEVKSWYIEDISGIDEFSQWAGDIICENLYIIRAEKVCYRCHRKTRVMLLATDRSYAKEEGYRLNTNLQILTFVTDMPKFLEQDLEDYKYYLSFSKAADYMYFMNHCMNCRAKQGDFYLHEMPEEAIYKHLFYENVKPCTFMDISDDEYMISITCDLPHYDEVANDVELMKLHIENSEIENRASMMVTQEKMNELLPSVVNYYQGANI